VQMWNQTTYLGVHILYAPRSHWATIQVLLSVVIGLGVALNRAFDLGMSFRDVALFPFTVWRSVQFELAHRRLTDTEGQIVREWKRSGFLQVVGVGPVSKEEARYFVTYNEETFRAALRRQRQVMMGLVILFFCMVLLRRTWGIYDCNGPYNLTSGCVDVSVTLAATAAGERDASPFTRTSD